MTENDQAPGSHEDLRPLGWSRVALGALFLVRTTPLLAPLDIGFLHDAVPLLAWPDGSEPLGPVGLALPANVRMVLAVVRTLAAFAFTLGVFTRPAGLLAGALGYVTVLQDPSRLNTTMHVLFLGTMILAVTDAGAAVAFRPSPARSPISSRWLVRSWTASIYFFAAVAKLRADWLDGRTLELFWQEGAFRGGLVDTIMRSPHARQLVAMTLAPVELALAPFLLLPRTRKVGLALALLLHITFEVVASPDVFGWAMVALLISFLPLPRSIVTDLAGTHPPAPVRR